VRTDRGYSLTELMVVVGLLGILSSMAVAQIAMSRPGTKGDSGMRVVLAQLVQAREMAITQRRNMRVTFTNSNQVDIQREEIPGPALTTLQTTVIEGGVQFLIVSGVPDTPDAFGNSSAVAFGSATEVKFNPQGQLVDQNGQMLNGTVFVALSQDKRSARAVTVLGSTGRVRGFRWNGTVWVKV